MVAEGLNEAVGTSSVSKVVAAGTLSASDAVKEAEKAKKEVAEAEAAVRKAMLEKLQLL